MRVLAGLSDYMWLIGVAAMAGCTSQSSQGSNGLGPLVQSTVLQPGASHDFTSCTLPASCMGRTHLHGCSAFFW